jgi:hypothetical protein
MNGDNMKILFCLFVLVTASSFADTLLPPLLSKTYHGGNIAPSETGKVCYLDPRGMEMHDHEGRIILGRKYLKYTRGVRSLHTLKNLIRESSTGILESGPGTNPDLPKITYEAYSLDNQMEVLLRQDAFPSSLINLSPATARLVAFINYNCR